MVIAIFGPGCLGAAIRRTVKSPGLDPDHQKQDIKNELVETQSKRANYEVPAVYKHEQQYLKRQ